MSSLKVIVSILG